MHIASASLLHVTRFGWFAALWGLYLYCSAHCSAQLPIPDFNVRPDDYTVLLTPDANHSPDLKVFQPGGRWKFYLTPWHRADQYASWDINAPTADTYAANVLIHRRHGALRVEVAAGEQRVSALLPEKIERWQRLQLNGTLHLVRGANKISVYLRPEPPGTEFTAEVMAVELIRPAVRDQLHRAAVQARANTTWMQQAKYGFMVHWTSQSCPRSGPPKPYAQAVQDFDVKAFAHQMQQGGAGFVVFTTSHGQSYFPAPLVSLDRILPGRTAQRDLVADLAAALNRRGIKLMLYYNEGDQSARPESGLYAADTTHYFDTWCSIIEEVGRRYGDKLAGWWFDDASVVYYHRNAPWQKMTAAAKAGYPERVVGYNPWILPPATEFQDFCCGEGFGDPAGDGTLPANGDGHYTTGPYAGLQACATLITEGDWGHFQQDRPIGKARWSAVQLAEKIAKFSVRRNVPIFDLEIYQDGTVSPETIALFRAARHTVHSK